MWAAAPFGFDFVRPSDGINLHSFGCLLSTSTSLVGKGIKDGGKWVAFVLHWPFARSRYMVVTAYFAE